MIKAIDWHDYLNHPSFTNGSPLTIPLGQSLQGEDVFIDMTNNPHLLIAGTTGSGKSVFLHSTINYLLSRNSPDTLRLILIDPKRVELTLYNNLPHLLTPVLLDGKRTIMALHWCVDELRRRYQLMEDLASNEASLPEPMPHILVVIDELSDIINAYPKESEQAIVTLAEAGQAVGIHLIIATSRPATNILTSAIKASIPGRLAFSTASVIDSNTLLDQAGAELLSGQGHALWRQDDTAKLVELQTPLINYQEVKERGSAIIQKAEQNNNPTNNTDILENYTHKVFMDDNDEYDEELYEEAKQVVREAGQATATRLQRILRIGYTRANRLIDMLEERGVVGPADGVKPREVIINKIE